MEGLLARRRRRGQPAHAPAPRGVRGTVARARRRVLAGRHRGRLPGRRPPGLRPQYADDYYGAFLLDPDGNSAEAIHDSRPNRTGIIDHLWIRVADVARAQHFYETIAPHAGLQLRGDKPDWVQFAGGAGGSFSLVPGTPTEHVHMAFGTDDDGAVERFHEAATAAGYRSRGAPGERPQYHRGYYAAYVFDPDGNNIEVVNHHRG